MLTDDQIQNLKWKNSEGSFRINRFIENNKAKIIKCFVGTDSQPGAKHTRFATSVCIQNSIGINFIVWTFTEKTHNGLTIERRIMKEVEFSIMIANYLTNVHNIELIEIHADINCNPKYRSFRCMHSAKGFVEGMGYRYVGKPCSWAASSVADWFTK